MLRLAFAIFVVLALFFVFKNFGGLREELLYWNQRIAFLGECTSIRRIHHGKRVVFVEPYYQNIQAFKVNVNYSPAMNTFAIPFKDKESIKNIIEEAIYLAFAECVFPMDIEFLENKGELFIPDKNIMVINVDFPELKENRNFYFTVQMNRDGFSEEKFLSKKARHAVMIMGRNRAIITSLAYTMEGYPGVSIF